MLSTNCSSRNLCQGNTKAQLEPDRENIDTLISKENTRRGGAAIPMQTADMNDGAAREKASTGHKNVKLMMLL